VTVTVAHLSAIGAEIGQSGMDTVAEYPEPFLETEEYRWRNMQSQQYEVAHTRTLLETIP